jgi:hypothetical protein
MNTSYSGIDINVLVSNHRVIEKFKTRVGKASLNNHSPDVALQVVTVRHSLCEEDVSSVCE